MKKQIAIASICLVLFGGVQTVNTTKTTVNDIYLEENGRYLISGYLSKTPQGLELLNESNSVKLNGSAFSEGLGKALVEKKGNEIQLLEFRKSSNWVKVIDSSMNGSTRVYETKVGRMTEEEVEAKKYVLFRGYYVR